ncbi:MAG: aldo/keto reductase [Verrucomicrobiota bacterium]|jgi:aryl-alcohol dehydrogenase-like predicted oxidoreductase
MQISRRQFLEQSVALGAAAALPLDALAAETPVRRASDVIELGPAKIKVSRMGVGTGTYGAGHSSNQLRSLGVEGVANMLKSAYEKGIFFWDTADAYGTHDAFKAALKTVPREKVTILTKTDAWTAEKTKADIDRFLKELGTDYIDILLLHTRMSPTWNEDDKGSMEVMAAAKEKKILRSVGISCHSVEAMQVASKSPWLDVCMVRLNPAGERMDEEPGTVLPIVKQMKANGKGTIGIKVLGEGTLVDGQHNEALRYALAKDALNCFSIGCESYAEVLDNVRRIEKLAVPA